VPLPPRHPESPVRLTRIGHAPAGTAWDAAVGRAAWLWVRPGRLALDAGTAGLLMLGLALLIGPEVAAGCFL
jgi:hypothetical protein